MSKTISWCILVIAAALVVVMAASAPMVLSDKNTFLMGFVNHEFLNLLGVILAITIASAAQLHLALNNIEEKHGGKDIFVRTRRGIRSGSYYLIALFLIGIVVVVAKPHLAHNEWSQTVFNGSALFILLWYALILVSVTNGILAVKADSAAVQAQRARGVSEGRDNPPGGSRRR
ncbi:hypothetical protein STHU_10080 [Allostella humosa]|uniref:hypothetical protein n=1 Tax=Stella humosa TaxID=94 RepID=UPI00113ABEA4|nr:hypothetical protein [Stella humosa]BBK30374.1 hypothetical protein STHU_10080 [Stella humosa]